jgi:tetratricopeptide (TPR) repeat protein
VHSASAWRFSRFSRNRAAALERIARELKQLACEGVPQFAQWSHEMSALLTQNNLPVAREKQAKQERPSSEFRRSLFSRLSMHLVEVLLLNCDARSLGRLICVSRFFGARKQSLIERVAVSRQRCQLFTPVLLPGDMISCTLQLARFETPMATTVEFQFEMAVALSGHPGGVREAVRLYRRILSSTALSSCSTVVLNLAKLLGEAPETRDEAVALYHNVLQTTVNMDIAAEVMFQLGFLLGKAPDGRELAVDMYRRMLALDAHAGLTQDPERQAHLPHYHCVLHNLAVLLQDGTETREEAEHLWRCALAVDANDDIALTSLANLLAETEREAREKTFAVFRRALAKKPDDAGALSSLASLLDDERQQFSQPTCERQHFEEAEALYRRALSADSKCVFALTNLATLLRFKAKEHLGRDGTEPECFTHARDRAGVLDEVEALYTRALAIEPECTDALEGLASFLRLTKPETSSKEAEALQQRAIALDPNWKWPYLACRSADQILMDTCDQEDGSDNHRIRR